jgi:SH3-like domain-containing protein
MKRTRKKYLVVLILFFLIFSFPIKGYANNNINFLSLKNSEVNLRQGPSFDHPIRFVYKKRFLPLIILEKSDVWLKTKDFQNNSGWIHISQLSNKKSAINIKQNSIIYKKSTIYSKPVARLEVGRLLLIKKCKADWCKVSTNNYNGWIFKKFLWGKIN